MKDYEEKVINIMDSAKDNIRIQFDKAYKSGYDQGYADALRKNAVEESDKAYQQGLEDAWEAARKITKMNLFVMGEIFGTVVSSQIAENNTAQEVISKIKEYEEKQKQDTIQVGDEVVSKLGKKGVVITDVPSENGYISVWFSASTHVQLYLIKDLVKTGKHYDQIAEVLAEMRGDKA